MSAAPQGAQGPGPVYMGTSEFAATVLRRLADSPHRPSLVVAPPDRRKGRGRKLAPPPVAAVASELELPLLQTARVNDPEPIEAIAATGSDVAVVCAFGQLIKEPLLSDLEMLNIHPSLLPRWRGAAPIERAMISGDDRTGVCVMRLTEGLDSGPVALREQTAIGPDEDYGALAERLAGLGGDLIVAALDRRAGGRQRLEFVPQPDQGVTYAEKIGPEDRRLDPARPAAELERTVRALTPHIGAFLELGDGDRLGVRSARALGAPPSGLAADPGAVGEQEGALIVSCSEGALAIDRLQPPGKREMDAADYLRGRRPPERIPAGL